MVMLFDSARSLFPSRPPLSRCDFPDSPSRPKVIKRKLECLHQADPSEHLHFSCHFAFTFFKPSNALKRSLSHLPMAVTDPLTQVFACGREDGGFRNLCRNPSY